MFQLQSNNTIGQYLNEAIQARYDSVRKFCRAYLEEGGENATDEAIALMQNRMSQITKGKASIQIYDLPHFCNLLDLSCEQILSAGACIRPVGRNMTNYFIASSSDEEIWNRHIARNDGAILCSDEFGKTVIDYAFDFKNYKFLKYLMHHKYIWFVDDVLTDSASNYFVNFGAGTSIKRTGNEALGNQLNNCETHGLRQKMIALAIEHEDLDMLVALRAREVPTFYQAYMQAFNRMPAADCDQYYNPETVKQIALSSEKILNFFLEEFSLAANASPQTFLYPFLPRVVQILVEQKKTEKAKLILSRALAHNNWVRDTLEAMMQGICDACDENAVLNGNVPLVELIETEVMCRLYHDEKNHLISYRTLGKNDETKLYTNLIRVDVQSRDAEISLAIERLNQSYQAVLETKPKFPQQKEV